jgi:hypothetical protein
VPVVGQDWAPIDSEPLASLSALVLLQKSVEISNVRAKLRQRLHVTLVVELTRLGCNRPAHDLPRQSQAPRYPSDALALNEVRSAYPSNRLHGHHPGWPPLQPEEAFAAA